MLHRLFVACVVGLVSATLSYLARVTIYPGAGDFGWALSTAQALLTGRDPYAFAPTPDLIPYPLPAAVFGLPFLWSPAPLAAALFFGWSSGLLAWGIVSSGERWRLLVFLSFPYVWALIFAQWTPLIMAAWFVPALAPLLVLIKPHIALPVALHRCTWSGVFIAAAILFTTLAIYPTWPWRWLDMLGPYQRIVPALVLPVGPLLLLAALRWRDERARLLLLMALLPLRAPYDLLALWLVPSSATAALLLTLASWLSRALWAPFGLPTVLVALMLAALGLVLWQRRLIGLPHTTSTPAHSGSTFKVS